MSVRGSAQCKKHKLSRNCKTAKKKFCLNNILEATEGKLEIETAVSGKPVHFVYRSFNFSYTCKCYWCLVMLQGKK